MSEIDLIGLTILALVLLTSIVQRVSGSGFGMILAPFLVLLVGAQEGVLLANFLSIFAPIFILTRTWHMVQWRKVWWLTIPALAIMPVAAWLTLLVPEGILYVTVGAVVIFGLMLSTFIYRVNIRVDGPTTRILTGLGVGAGTTLAAVGAPATAIYTVISRWPVAAMIATVQPVWLVVSLASFMGKISLDGIPLPDLAWWAWAGSLLMIVAGMFAGEWLQRTLNENVIRRVVTVVAFCGGVLALGTGIAALVGD